MLKASEHTWKSTQNRPESLLAGRFAAVRAQTRRLCAPLSAEDCLLQAAADVSPPKWHLAHTTWFFEAFVLKNPELTAPGSYREFDPAFHHLFNSYYETLGSPYARPRRGLLSRPDGSAVQSYRAYVEDAVLERLSRGSFLDQAKAERLIALGLEHEQQHQELILTDTKYNFAANPLKPAYRPDLRERTDLTAAGSKAASDLTWCAFPGGVVETGHAGPGFAFDNEGPRHEVLLQPFQLAAGAVTNAEIAAFIEDGGYRRSDHWLSDGWAAVQEQRWEAPLYWERRGRDWWTMTLAGMQPLPLAAPACHLSFYEADAFASWAGARLPMEAEWEAAAADKPVRGNFVESDRLQPAPALPVEDGPAQLFGDVWEWTASAYLPYPGYRAEAGALGEYNGKFMINQMVLRGGSCYTAANHVRATYRNFFPPPARWQCTGVRLARDL